ncbi:MAG: hypothetical protein ABI175_19160 [Polyangiales bacterium]
MSQSFRLLVAPVCFALVAVAFAAPAVADDVAAPEAPIASVSASASVDPVPVAPPQVVVGIPQALHASSVPKSVASGIRAVKPALESCYAEAIKVEGDTEGSVDLRLEIDSPGRVVSATISASRELSSRLRGCVRDAFAGVSTGSVGPAPLEVLVPLVFSRPVPEDATRAASACPGNGNDPDAQGQMTDELRAALKDRAVRASFCFKRGAAPGEPAALKGGSMELSMRIATDGTVCGVTAIGDGFGRPSLTSCVLETMSGPFMEHPAGVVDVTIPLVFKGS